LTSLVRLAGVELGGTKTIVVLAGEGTVIEQRTIATTTPAETLQRARESLTAWDSEEPLSALGIASFGPLQLNRNSPDFGRMYDTPKPGWSGTDVAGALSSDLACPWTIDTDVNGAALAEYCWGAGQGHSSLWYITVGTGVGGGLLIDGRPVHGAMHPEIGHKRVRRPAGDGFTGVCPFHGDCIEGLVSGPALGARFGCDPEAISDADPGWNDVAADLAELVATLLLTTAATAILFGGSVITNRPFLLPLINRRTLARLSGYLPAVDMRSIDEIVRLASLGEDAGPRGALALADQARQERAARSERRVRR
jgi:fructokinase